MPHTSNTKTIRTSHNPYFNRWFSAIPECIQGHCRVQKSHNPYFNRWFSAIQLNKAKSSHRLVSQSLF